MTDKYIMLQFYCPNCNEPIEGLSLLSSYWIFDDDFQYEILGECSCKFWTIKEFNYLEELLLNELI